MKPLKMTFVRGPLHLIQADMTWIPEVHISCDNREKLVYVYHRDETTYFYDPEMSAMLTSIYEEVKNVFKKNKIEVTGFAENKPTNSLH